MREINEAEMNEVTGANTIEGVGKDTNANAPLPTINANTMAGAGKD